MRRLPDFEAWAMFAKVAQLGSFARAAEDLALSRPTVSKAVSRLEASLGFSLLNRTSRHLSLTEAGRVSTERAVRILLVGAPGYLDRHGRPTHPGELRQHLAMVYTGSPSGALWRFSHPQFGEASVEPRVCLWTDNADMLTPSLIAGRGLALQPEFLVWNEIRDGSLEIAMPDWTAPSLGLHLLMPPSSLRPLRVRALVEYLAKSLARTDWGVQGN